MICYLIDLTEPVYTLIASFCSHCAAFLGNSQLFLIDLAALYIGPRYSGHTPEKLLEIANYQLIGFRAVVSIG